MTEQKRVCEAVGADYRELELDNWNLEEDYMDASYEALKQQIMASAILWGLSCMRFPNSLKKSYDKNEDRGLK